MARRKIDLEAPARSTVVNAATGKPAEKRPLPLLCERIRFFREKSGLEQKAFAARLGVTANAVSNWERGRARPDVNLLPAVCRALGVTLGELFGEAPSADPLSAREKALLRDYRALGPADQYVIDKTLEALRFVQKAEKRPALRPLPYFERPLAAGVGDPTEFEQEAETIYLYASPEVERADYVFRVNGDSMEPVYHSGGLVLVRKLSGASPLRPGEIGAFIVGNETYIKEYREDGLHSLNQKYPVLRFDEEQAVYLIGKALGPASEADVAGEEDVRAYLAIHGAEQ
ncbi:MAG: helix-turn-helix domain-containing protein [Oscillospiraceae bacterium]|nr:helix-turn-helix domain-containing protein [Oscillospiraceae bacterium]